MPSFRQRMESRRFLRLVAEARRRYGGGPYLGPPAPPRPEPPRPADDQGGAPAPPTPCEESHK